MASVASQVVAGGADESVLIQGTSAAVSKTAANLSLAKMGPLITTFVGGAVVLTTLLSAVTIVGVLVATSTPLPPVAVPDYYTAHKSNVYTFNVLDNDYDPRNINVTISGVEQPAHGRVEISETEVQLRYYSPASFSGSESFNYTITNGKVTASAEVTVDVLNLPPDTVDITYAVGKNVENFEAHLFDYVTDAGRRIVDLDNDTLKITEVSTPLKGTVQITEDGRTVLYTAEKGFRGVDSMTYTVSDGYDTSTSSLRFTIENQRPIAVSDEYRKLKKDTVHRLEILLNDKDPNGDPFWIADVFNVCPDASVIPFPSDRNGNFTVLTPSRSASLLEPAAGYPDRKGCAFQYTITDGDLSSTANVYLTLTNEPPHLFPAELTVNKNGVASIELTTSDEDEFDTVTLQIEKQASHGVAKLDFGTHKEARTYLEISSREVITHNYTLTYTPDHGFVGEDSVDIRVSDGFDSEVVTIPLTTTNEHPVAVDDQDGVNIHAECLKNLKCTLPFSALLKNDYDPNGDNVDVVTSSAGSTCEHCSDLVFDVDTKTVSFTPDLQAKNVRFTYRVTDRPSNEEQYALESIDLANVNIQLINAPPQLVDHEYTVFMKSESTFNILEGSSDPNGDDVIISYVGPTTRSEYGSSVQISGDGKSVLYTAPNAVTGDSFEYRVKDVESAESVKVGVVVIDVINTPPVAEDIHATTHWRRSDALPIDISGHVSDVEGSDVTLVSVSYSGSEASVSVSDSSTIHFTPSPIVQIHDITFDYTVTDGFDTTTKKVIVTITNTAPVAEAISGEVHHSGSICVPYPADSEDVDGDAVSLGDSIISQPSDGVATISRSGSGAKCVKYEAAHVKDSFEIGFQVTDSKALSNGVATVKVTNQAPVANADESQVHWRTALETGLSVNVLANDVDADNDPLSIQSVNKDSGEGTVSHTASSIALSFAPTAVNNWANPSGRSVVVSYTITDKCEADSSQLTVAITNKNTPKATSAAKSFHWREVQDGKKVILDPLNGRKNDADGDTLTLSNPQTTEASIAEITENKIRFTMGGEKIGVATPVSVSVSDGLDSALHIIDVTATNNEPVPVTIAPITYRFVDFEKNVSFELLSRAEDADILDKPHLKISSCAIDSSVDFTAAVASVGVEENGCVFKADECGENGDVKVKYGLTDGRAEVFETVTIKCDPEPLAYQTTKHWRAVKAGEDIRFMSELGEAGDFVESVTTQSNHGISTVLDDNKGILFTFNGVDRSALGEEIVYVKISNAVNPVAITITVVNNAPSCTSSVRGGVHWRDLQNGVEIDLNSLVTENDVADQSHLSISSASGSEHGSATTLGMDLTYTLTEDYAGSDSVTYVVSDGLETCSSKITFVSTNTPPTAGPMTKEFHWSVIEAGTGTVDALDGASDLESDSISLVVDSVEKDPSFVDVVVSGSTLTFKKGTADIADIIGESTTISFDITDGVDVVKRYLQLSVVNKKPVGKDLVVDVHATTRITSGFEIDLSGEINDDDDEDTAVVGEVNIGSNFEDMGANKVRYTPPAGTEATAFSESFTYTVSDGAQSSGPYTVTVKVINEAPTAKAISKTITPDETPVVDVVAEGCEDADVGEDLVLNFNPSEVEKVGAVYGGVTGVGGGKIKYTPGVIPDSAYVDNKATQKFTFICRDIANAKSSRADIVFTIQTVPPAVAPLTKTINRVGNGPAVTYNVFSDGGLSNEGGKVTLIGATYNSGSHGTVTAATNGNIHFAPTTLPKATTDIVITYTLKNSYREASSTLTIKYVNTAPVCGNTAPINLYKNTLRTVVSGEGTDANNDALTYSNLRAISGGDIAGVEISTSGSSFLVDTYAKKSGEAKYEYDLYDGASVTTCELVINVENRKPVANDLPPKETLRRYTSQTFWFDISGSDADADDRISLHTVELGDCEGTVSKVDGRIKFVAASNLGGSCSLQYTVIDDDVNGALVSDTAEIPLSFVDGALRASDDVIFVDQGTAIQIPFSELFVNDVDENGDPLTFDVAFFNSAEKCKESGSCKVVPTISGNSVYYQATSENCDSDKFTYKVTSRNGKADEAVVTIKLQNCECKQPLDIVLVLDGSRSIVSGQWKQIKDFNSKLLERLTISSSQVNFGVVQFGDQPTISSPYGFELEYQHSKVKSKLDDLKQLSGGTNTRGGLRVARDMLRGGRSGVGKVAVVLTDGDANLPCFCGTSGGGGYDGCNKVSSLYDFGGLRSGVDSNKDGKDVCNAIGALKWNGRTCSQCDPWSACQPCSDPTYESDVMSDEGTKVVAFAVGDSLTTNGVHFVTQMHFEKVFIKAKWKGDKEGDQNAPTLDELMSKIVDMSCRDN